MKSSQALVLVCLLALAGLVCAKSEKDKLCNQVAADSEFDSHEGDECTLTCYLSYLGLFKAHLDWGTSCENGQGRCALGECWNRPYEPPKPLDTYEIRIKEAQVTSADEFTASDSDPFVVVSLFKGSSATFGPGTRLCRTPTLWQKANPSWDFSCRKVVLERGAVLKFSVYDMDTLRAELLGEATRRVSELVESGETRLKLTNSYRGSSGQTLDVEVTRCPFEPRSQSSDSDDNGSGDQLEEQSSS